MSSTIWTADELSSSAQPLAARAWRAVEAQHRVSTAKLTDTLAEQERLEQLIEASKPVVPEECRHLHYLLSTPFRYGALYPRGSRFRRAGLTAGVFYGSELCRTAMTELAFYRLLFFAESPDTPWPTNPAEYTAFAVEFATERALNSDSPAAGRISPAMDRSNGLFRHPVVGGRRKGDRRGGDQVPVGAGSTTCGEFRAADMPGVQQERGGQPPELAHAPERIRYSAILRDAAGQFRPASCGIPFRPAADRHALAAMKPITTPMPSFPHRGRICPRSRCPAVPAW